MINHLHVGWTEPANGSKAQKVSVRGGETWLLMVSGSSSLDSNTAWPGSLCSVLGQDTSLLQCFSLPKWVPVNFSVKLIKWCMAVACDVLASRRGSTDTLSHFVLQQQEWRAGIDELLGSSFVNKIFAVNGTGLTFKVANSLMRP